MRVRLARTAGFCMGVRRAVELAEDAAAKGGTPVYTHGPLIHNAQAVDVLAEQGVRPVDAIDELPRGRLVIRAHGIPRAEQERAEALGFECIDATCPHVVASQRRIARASAEGRDIVLVGDPEHAEIVGLAGHATTPVHIIADEAEAKAFVPERPVCVIGQTTYNAKRYREICAILQDRSPDAVIHDSICMATDERQAEARRLAEECDAVVVVGGRHSANTLRLAQVAGETGKPVFHVETAGELDMPSIALHNTVGVTAGASTPGWLTQSVIDRLQTAGTPGWRGVLDRLTGAAIRSYIYSALGAVGLALAVAQLLEQSWLPGEGLFIIFSYIFAVYVVNHRPPAPSPDHQAQTVETFFGRNRIRLLLLAGALGVVSFYLAWRFGRRLPALLAVAYVAGIVYTVPLLPAGFIRRRLKDIPASKDIFVALAWTAVTVFVPVFSLRPSPTGWAIAAAAVFVFLLVFGKTAALDLRDTEGDRLVGTETIPVLVGRSRTLHLLYAIQFAAAGLLVTTTAFGLLPPFGWLLLTLPLYGIVYLRLFRSGLLTEEVRCQAIVDGQFLLAGLLGIGWGLAGGTGA